MLIVDRWMFSLGLEHIHASGAASDMWKSEKLRAAQRALCQLYLNILAFDHDYRVGSIELDTIYQSGDIEFHVSFLCAEHLYDFLPWEHN